MQKLLGIIKRFTTGLGPVEQAQIVASTAVVVSMVTIVSAIAATGQVPRLMDFISVLTIGLFGFTSVMFSLRYGRQLDAQRRQLLALNTTAEAVNAIVDRAGFLETTLVHLHAALGTTSGWVYTLNNGSLELVAGAMSRQDDIIPLLGVAAADVLAWSRVPHILQNSSQVETEALPSAVRSTGIHFLCTVPLRVRDTLVGTIVLAGEKDTTLPVQPELLEAFSKQLSAGLNNVRLVEELRESRTRYADLFEHSPDAYFIIRENGTILDCNATACSLIGTKKESLLGHSFDALFSSDRQEELRQRIRDMWDGEADLRDVEETINSSNGHSVVVHLNGLLVTDADGRTTNARIVTRDITHRKKIEKALVHAQKIDSIGSLAGGIAHDFNNLLTAVSGSASILRKHVSPDPRVNRFLDIIDSSVLRGSTLTRQLLTFARKTERQTNTVDVNALLTNTLGLFERNIPREISIETHLTVEPAFVRADEGQVQQALLNVLLNARDAMPGGGVVTVETSILVADSHMTSEFSSIRPGPFVAITVKDQGKGIPPGIRGRIFEPFFSTKDQGTGLGLSVVYGVIQAHGGFLVIDSLPDVGTTITLYLPRILVKSAEPSEGARLLPRGTEHVLAIDDEEAVTEILSEMITSLGYTVDIARNGKAGIERYRSSQGSIDLILLDVNMPVMDGHEAFDEIRRINPHANIIIVTGYGRKSAETSSFSGPVQAIIQKPFQIETLALTLRQVLDQRALTSAHP